MAGRITRKKTGNGFTHFSGCSQAKVAVTLKHPGCNDKVIYTFGCAGFCKSEASLVIGEDALLPKCTCCKPKTYVKFIVPMDCPGKKEKVEKELLGAVTCECQICSAIRHINKKQKGKNDSKPLLNRSSKIFTNPEGDERKKQPK